jgi:hypothetical protein
MKQALSRVKTSPSIARSIGQEVTILNARTIRDIDAAFAILAQMRADALLVVTDAFFFTRAAQLVVLAARHAIPTVYFRREFVAAGGLMSYGGNQNESLRVVGVYAARIIKGEKPGDLPIQRPTKVELILNLKTAKALGLTVPLTLLEALAARDRRRGGSASLLRATAAELRSHGAPALCLSCSWPTSFNSLRLEQLRQPLARVEHARLHCVLRDGPGTCHNAPWLGGRRAA